MFQALSSNSVDNQILGLPGPEASYTARRNFRADFSAGLSFIGS